MNRSDLQRLARIRLLEARRLLDAHCYDGAYYLAGYAVECGLKACIAKMTRRYDFPDRKQVLDSYTHDLDKLVRTAGLEADLVLAIRTDATFGLNWGVAKDWSEESRYALHSQQKAEQVYMATADRRHGVLRWLRQHW